MKIVLKILISALFLSGIISKGICQESIRMHYLGLPEKPYPTVLFYHCENIDSASEDFFVHKYKIYRNVFLKICSIIEGQNLEVDSIALPDMYEFVVKKSGTEKKYRTSYLIPIIKIFKGSLDCLKNSEEYVLIKGYLEQTIRRFGYQLY